MPTTYTNGLKLPDLGSIDWYNSYKNNIDILDPIVGTVNGVATTYAPISHNHSASEITSGTIDIARLPPAALERMHIVADQTARYALTTSTVQEGDTVKQTDTGVMYLVVDSTKLNSADGYTEYSAGTASKAIADEDGTSIKTGYVNVAGNQTVSGQKVWTQAQVFQNNVYLANTSYTVGTIPTSNITSTCFFSGASNYQIGYCRSVVYKTTGQTSAELTARNKFTNGALDPNGDYTNATFTVNLDADGTRWIQFANSSIKNGLTPYATDTYNIGSATNQWLRLFAKYYYYNGTAWGLDQNNTWTNTNTYTNNFYFKDPTVVKGMAVTSDRAQNIWDVIDSNDVSFGAWQAVQYSDNRQGFRLAVSNNYLNGALDPTGTSISTYFQFLQTGGSAILKWIDGFVDNNILPIANNYSLGSAWFQWSSVYAQTYYYNGTAWGLDKANVWTGNNEYKSVLGLTGGEIWFKDPAIEDITSNPSSDISKSIFQFYNKTQTQYTGGIIERYLTDGTHQINISCLGFQLNNYGVYYAHSFYFEAKRDGTGSFFPSLNNVNLGTSTNKWKTLNGINPGVLSLPDNSNAINLDTTNWGVSGELNHYAPTINGWLCISVKGGANNGLFLMDTSSGFGQSCYGNANETVAGRIKVALPVIASRDVLIIIHADSNSDIYEAKLYPCLGNV